MPIGCSAVADTDASEHCSAGLTLTCDFDGSLSCGPIKVLLYLVSRYHLCNLICGCVCRLWKAVVCVCVL